jgi:hypothetical protein
LTYTTVPSCTNNHVFKNNGGASDATAGHYLTDTICENCGENAWSILDDPKE